MIAVIIPSRLAANLRACVASVRRHEPDVLILVVDDGLEEIVRLPENSGRLPGDKPFIFARNVNKGMCAAMAIDPKIQGFVLLNDDALLESPGGFTLLANECEAHPEYGLIAATTNVTGQSEQWRSNAGLRPVNANIPFIAVYIPRRTIDLVGFLDERYCLDYGCEDNDYNEAVHRAGLLTGVHDGCYVDHGSLVSTFRGLPETPKSFQQNYALFLEKCGYCDRTGQRFTAGAGLAVHA